MPNIFTDAHTPVHGVARKTGITAAATIVIPKGAVVTRVIIHNTTANAVTGGVSVGTTLAGTDVLAAGAVAASVLVSYNPLIGASNLAADRTLYIGAVTAWNSASVDVAVEYTECL